MWVLVGLALHLIPPVPSAYVHPTEVHIEYVSSNDHRAAALGLASFAVKAVKKHPGFDLVKPDLWAGPGRYEIHLSLVIEGKPEQPHRVGIAWQVWFRDENNKRQQAWVSGMDQVHGTHDNIVHEGGERVLHGIDSILKGFTKIDTDWIERIKKHYGKQTFDL